MTAPLDVADNYDVEHWTYREHLAESVRLMLAYPTGETGIEDRAENMRVSQLHATYAQILRSFPNAFMTLHEMIGDESDD